MNSEKSNSTQYLPARVIAEHKESYRVKTENNTYFATVTGRKIFEAQSREDYPAVGDWVLIEPVDQDKALIQEILPRKSVLRKKYTGKKSAQIIATNIDTAFIVEAVDRDYNLNRFERYIVLVNNGKIKPVIIFNKIDLISEKELDQKINEIKTRIKNVNVLKTSTVTENGLKELTQMIEKTQTYCFLGSSGVGKSSLINKLLEKDEIKTREISLSTGKGKHTTTTRDLYFMKNGGILIDNPGTREVGIVDVSENIENVFDNISSLAQDCKFINCTHVHEPGCAVREAVKNGKLDKAKYQNYLKIKKENDFYEMTDFEKRDKDRRFGKYLKSYQKQMKEME